MARAARQWSDIDIAAMQYIAKLRKEAGMPSYRKMAEDTDIKFNRVMDLLKGQNGVPTLQEFISLCLLFGHRPSDAMDEVMRHVEMQRTMSADEARVEETKRLLRENPMALTAYHDPDKQHYIDGDGIDPA